MTAVTITSPVVSLRARGVSAGLAGRLADLLTPAELAELAQLIGPSQRDLDVWADMTRQVAADALNRGRAEGWVRCNSEHKAVQQGLVMDLRLERRRWRRVCAECRRRPVPRERCRDCQDGPRVQFATPQPGEYRGGPVPAW
jgi:hypothetical protein